MKRTSYSHPRPKSKGDITPKLVRTQMDSVSGELVRTILDDVQLRYESVVRFLEGKVHFGDGILTDRGKTRRFHERVVLYLLRFLVRDPEWNQDEAGRLREVCAGLLERVGGEAVFEGEGAGV